MTAAFLSSLFTALMAVSAPAQQVPMQAAGDPSTRVVQAARTATPPVIDGRLDDAAWAAARPMGDFVQREPVEGRAASERTEVRVLFDNDAIYVGARLYDADPSSIVVGERRRDASLQDTDAFLMILDTYRDRQNGFVFGTSPLGIEYDGQVANEGSGGGGAMARQQTGAGGGFNLNWDGSWTVATSVDAEGWTAEFRIPFSTLRYAGGGEQTWGINFARHIRRRNEQSFWAPIPRQFSLYRVSLAGTLEGIEVPARRTAQVTPYGLSAAQRNFVANTPTDYDWEFGADAKIGITPSLTLDLTYNTDFAQVEVDEQQVNLTRFRLRFPEKRPFFLENAGTFAVGAPGMAELFFSRRIGIGDAGFPVPIVGGGRLSGKVGGLNVGLLNIHTEDVGLLQPANNYTVARVQKELPNRSALGALITNRFSPARDVDHARTYAVDGRVGIGQPLTVDAFVAGTETPGLSGDQHAFRIRSDYNSPTWRGNLGFTEIGENFSPAVGFVPRSGFRYYESFLLRTVRTPGVSWLRELRPHTSLRSYRNFQGVEETREFHIDSHVEFANGAFFSPAFNLVREELLQLFEIAPGVIVQPGLYSNWEAAWRFNTNESANFSLNGGFDVGGFLSGDRRSVFMSVAARQGGGLATSLRVQHNDIELAEGSFDATLVTGRVAYSFTPRIFLQTLVQYNSQISNWSGNVRFGWLNTAGTGLFLVFNEQQEVLDSGSGRFLNSQPQNRAVFLKFTRQFDVMR